MFCDVRRAFVSGWLVLAGCGDDGPDHDEDSTCFRIYGASLDPDAIVPPEVQGAVVMLAMSEEGQEGIHASCSGSLVAPGVILTAAHCVVEAWHTRLAAMAMAPDPPNDCAFVPVRDPIVHPDFDVALYRFDAEELSADPLPIAMDRVPEETPVVIAGYGLDELGVAGVRRFAETRVSDQAEEYTIVGVREDIGACVGDSGGPILWNREGRWHVAGALSSGEASCVGLDAYVATAVIADWVHEASRSP